ncbi:MAG: CHRD domain-containing protein [Chitinophagaceae bacterium]|nr:MAG: CHRD domain-containing protein [Chitinophagaceae bacterium]
MYISLTRISLLSFLLLFLSCDKDTETVNNPVYNLRGNASGDQEAPNKVATTATGTITGTYNKESNLLTYTITWNGLTGGNPTMMHFHGPAEPGKAAGVRLPITGFTVAASGTVSGTQTGKSRRCTLANNRIYGSGIRNRKRNAEP